MHINDILHQTHSIWQQHILYKKIVFGKKNNMQREHYYFSTNT